SELVNEIGIEPLGSHLQRALVGYSDDTDLNAGLARCVHVARPQGSVRRGRAPSGLAIEVREVDGGANAIAKHRTNDLLSSRSVADAVRLETVPNALAPGIGGLLNQLVRTFEPGGWQEHDLSALPVDGHRRNGLALHVVEQLVDDYGQLLV